MKVYARMISGLPAPGAVVGPLLAIAGVMIEVTTSTSFGSSVSLRTSVQVPSVMPRRRVIDFSCLLMYCHARPRVSTDCSGANSESMVVAVVVAADFELLATCPCSCPRIEPGPAPAGAPPLR